MGTGIYSNVRIWDGISSDYRVGAIEVADGRISAISDSRGGRDCSGLTAIPGLMDAHVHMTLDHSIHPVKEQLEQTNDEIREKMLVRAQKNGRSGNHDSTRFGWWCMARVGTKRSNQLR
ncbi:MAG: hypothetical protein CM1200mP24_05240 [Gammaproteobacteria bacterium]|nr:MAG: hypothetical protein CM1200mP24_05240 [Gammaproteobacteria bacterium]